MDYELSYLIRMGAGKHPQCLGQYFQRADSDEIVATCAVGAAIIALEHLTGEHLASYEAVMRAVIGAQGLGADLVWWNDIDLLTREEIADKLDALPGGSPTVRV